MPSQGIREKTANVTRYRIIALLIALGAIMLVGGLAVSDAGPISPAQAQQPGATEISNWTELNTTVRNNPNGEYVLVNDLNQSTPGYAQVAGPSANGGDGFLPIGNLGTPFNGTFDGRGHSIRDFVINRPTDINVGMFGYIGPPGSVDSVSLTNVTVDGGDFYVGSLAGYSLGTVTDSTAEGSVAGSDNFTGGLIGVNDNGTITGSQASVVVTGDLYVGGLVGGSTGTVTDSQASGDVTGEEYIGGLAGAIGIGGPAAPSEPTITASQANGDVTGVEYVGGLVGGNGLSEGGISGGEISRSTASGTVNITQSSGTEAIGGLVGENFQGTIMNTTATGDVIAPDATDVGGLVGYTGIATPGPGFSEVSASDATGTVDGNKNVGGLIGRTFGDTVSDNEARGDVTGTENVGGLIGLNEGAAGSEFETVEKSHATGDVTGMNNTGGLIGTNRNDKVTNTYALGDVTGDTNTGGLIGLNEKTDTGLEVLTVTASFAAGDVAGDLNTGGLIGTNNNDTVRGTYALSDVSGDTNTGGLVGSNTGSSAVITLSFAVGSVSGPTATGGLVGTNSGLVVDSYWDTNTTSQLNSAGSGSTGLPTSEMRGVTPTAQGADTMSAFGFDRDGGIGWFAVVAGEQINPTPEADCYPILQGIDANAQLDTQDMCEADNQLGLGDFEVVAISNETPTEVAVDESFSVQYTVENVGEDTGRQGIRLEIDGTEVATKPDTLTSGQLITNSFTDVTLPEDVEPGDTVELTVRTNNDAQTKNLTVTGVQPPVVTAADYANENGVVVITGVSDAISDWQSGEIGITLVSDVIAAWQSGDPVT